jgi:DNA polymerase III delta subunit
VTPAQVRARLADGTIAPVYLLESEDAPSRHELVHAFVSLVDEGLRAFNVTTFFAREASSASDRDTMFSAIVSTARTLPMMSPRRVVIVHEAEALLAPRRAKDDVSTTTSAKARAKNATAADDFETYLERPERLTALVLDVARLDRSRRVTKLLLEHAVVVDCGTLDTPADAARWIKARLDPEEMAMEPAAIAALVDATGLHLPTVRREIDKLVLYAAGESTITAAHVRDVVLPVEEPGEDFALGKAIWASDAAAAVREVAAQCDAGAPAPMVLGQVRAAALRLRPDARARRALSAVLDSDLAIKSSRGEPRFVLERLVIELCAGPPSSGGWGRR